ncbi:hypothetical protein JCM33374_g2076 [Metschnikowia sp. JCM 33374]|nr:hypothetical protein JCM33374_g2076 [Metschnikowia sp. JCM 33374]
MPPSWCAMTENTSDEASKKRLNIGRPCAVLKSKNTEMRRLTRCIFRKIAVDGYEDDDDETIEKLNFDGENNGLLRFEDLSPLSQIGSEQAIRKPHASDSGSVHVQDAAHAYAAKLPSACIMTLPVCNN